MSIFTYYSQLKYHENNINPQTETTNLLAVLFPPGYLLVQGDPVDKTMCEVEGVHHVTSDHKSKEIQVCIY